MSVQDSSDAQPARVDFPVAADGRRSTSALGRAVISDALRRTDPAGALGAEQETNWRSGYLTHFRRLIEAGLSSPDAALAIASDGLCSVHARMRAVLGGGEETGLDGLLTGPAPGRCGAPSGRNLSGPCRTGENGCAATTWRAGSKPG